MTNSHATLHNSSSESGGENDRHEREALLTIAGQRMLVILKSVTERSCDVLLYEPPPFWVNDTGELQTDYGALQVRVGSVLRIEEEDEKSMIYQIALEEIDDTMVQNKSDDEDPVETPRPVRKRNSRWRRVAAIAMIIMAAPVMIYGSWKCSNLLLQGKNASDKNSANATGATATAGTEVAANQGANQQARRSGPTREQMNLPGAQTFVLPEVVAALHMPTEQATALREIQEATDQAVRDLEVVGRTYGREKYNYQLNMIYDAARQQAQQLLNAEQQRQFAELAK